MDNTDNSGFLVQTKSGKTGRTFHSKERRINGKVPVYLEKDGEKFNFSDSATLVHEENVRVIGFID